MADFILGLKNNPLNLEKILNISLALDEPPSFSLSFLVI